MAQLTQPQAYQILKQLQVALQKFRSNSVEAIEREAR